MAAKSAFQPRTSCAPTSGHPAQSRKETKNASLFPALFFWALVLGELLSHPCLAEDFSFVVVGDTHGDAAVVLNDAHQRYPDAAFVANTGDNAAVGNYLGWDGFDEKVIRAYGANFPWFMALGNHNADNWKDLSYYLTNLYPTMQQRLAGIASFSQNPLSHERVEIAAFDVFKPSASQDKRLQVINKLVAAGLGYTEPAGAAPLSAQFFVWSNPELAIDGFVSALNAASFSDCVTTSSSTDTEEEIRNILKALYLMNKAAPYSFDYKNAHFIFLNLYYDHWVNNNSHICEHQMQWIREDLARNTKPLVFAFAHEPGYPWGNRHLGDSLDRNPEQRDELFSLLRQHGGVVYYSGHTHVPGRSFHDGVYDLGVGGATTSENGRYSYVVTTVNDHKVRFELLSRNMTQTPSQFELADDWTVDMRDPVKTRWRSITPGPGGWVTALAIDPNDSKRVLAGSDVFGTAVSNDGGLTWEPAFGFKMTEMESFFMPQNPYGGNCYYQFAATLGGVYETYDCGHDWMEKIAQGKWYGGSSNDVWPEPSLDAFTRPVASVAYAYGSLYSASGSMRRPWLDPGLFGLIYKFNFHSDTQSWTFVADLKSATGGEANIQHLIAQDLGTGVNRLFVSLRDGGVWRSDDGGANWANTNIPVAHTYTMADNPQQKNTLYVAAGEDGIYKTENAGSSWTRLPVDVVTEVIGICQANPNVLYAGSFSGANRGVMKSTNGGTSWQKVFDGYSMPILPNPHGSTGIKFHALAVDPKDPNHVIVGDDVNLYVTFDGGANWTSGGGLSEDGGRSWTSTNFGGLCLEFAAFDAQNDAHFLIGAADGGLWQTWNGGQTFERPVTDVLGEPNGDPGEVFTDFQDGAISHQNSKKVYVVGDIDHQDQGPLFKSENGGESWNRMNDGPFGSIALSSANDAIMVAASGGVLKRSVDGGHTFTSVSGDIDAVRVSADPSNSNVFYSTSETGVYRSTDAGAHWSSIGGPHVWGRFGKVAVDQLRQGVIYATSFGGFWKFDGSAWSMMKEVEFASDITTTAEGVIYGATTSFPEKDRDPVTTGIWRSDDGGASWYRDIEGIRNKRIDTITASPFKAQVIGGSCGIYLYDYDASDSGGSSSSGSNPQSSSSPSCSIGQAWQVKQDLLPAISGMVNSMLKSMRRLGTLAPIKVKPASLRAKLKKKTNPYLAVFREMLDPIPDEVRLCPNEQDCSWIDNSARLAELSAAADFLHMLGSRNIKKMARLTSQNSARTLRTMLRRLSTKRRAARDLLELLPERYCAPA